MKYLALTLCLAGSLGLAACGTTDQYGSGANYATGRTAGEQATQYVAAAKSAPAKVESVFKSQLSK